MVNYGSNGTLNGTQQLVGAESKELVRNKSLKYFFGGGETEREMREGLGNGGNTEVGAERVRRGLFGG